MPSRMPNWKMRANRLVDGRPTIKALQDAEPGIGLHDPHQTEDGVRRHEAVGIERDGELVAAAPALAKIADIAGLDSRC